MLKKRIFWLTYILDKSLSLRMGHSSILQDFDITLDLPELSADSRMSMWDILHRQWVKVGYFQGRIYEELYSPRALSEQESTRTRRARAIAEEMQTWYQEILRVCFPSFQREICELTLELERPLESLQPRLLPSRILLLRDHVLLPPNTCLPNHPTWPARQLHDLQQRMH